MTRPGVILAGGTGSRLDARSNLGRMKVRDIVRRLRQDGWYIDRIRGSHHHFKHATKPQVVTVPIHRGRDLGVETVRSILKQAGLEP